MGAFWEGLRTTRRGWLVIRIATSWWQTELVAFFMSSTENTIYEIRTVLNKNKTKFNDTSYAWIYCVVLGGFACTYLLVFGDKVLGEFFFYGKLLSDGIVSSLEKIFLINGSIMSIYDHGKRYVQVTGKKKQSTRAENSSSYMLRESVGKTVKKSTSQHKVPTLTL